MTDNTNTFKFSSYFKNFYSCTYLLLKYIFNVNFKNQKKNPKYFLN